MSLFSSRQLKFVSSTVAILLGYQSWAIASPTRNNAQGNDILPLLLAQNNEVLFPNPQVTIDGQPVRPGRIESPPPFQQRAVAPPIGDISVSNTDLGSQIINLGTTAVVPRLVLRDAPLDEVLKILARAANISIMFDYGSPETISRLREAITIDLEGERVQDIFNNLLRVYSLEAHREGNTIFVGDTLSHSVNNSITRTLRLNQADALTVAAQLAISGATVQQIMERYQSSDSVAGNDPETRRTFLNFQTQATGTVTNPVPPVRGVIEREIVPLVVDLENNPGTPQPLRRLNVIVDERSNSITLTGTADRVRIATNLITQSDIRRRQVAVNVKIIDINLTNDTSLNSSFSFGVNNTSVTQTGGAAIIDFLTGAQGSGLTREFSATIESAILSGNAKILTDPTLIVQEGQNANVGLTQQVFGGFEEIQTINPDGSSTRTRRPIINDAGVILNLNIHRIDDNGFISLNLRPEISGIAGSQQTQEGVITLTQQRRLNSGLIRLKDRQTLVLTGIIQSTDRASVSKVPILGDLPLLGALFRSTNNVTERNEVVVLVTPTILDDSESYGGIGYRYTPSAETGQILRNRGVNIPGSPF